MLSGIRDLGGDQRDWVKVGVDGRHCYYSLTRHHLHRQIPWSTSWHSGNATSTLPFLRETRDGDIDLEAKQLMYGSWSMRDSSSRVL